MVETRRDVQKQALKDGVTHAPSGVNECICIDVLIVRRDVRWAPGHTNRQAPPTALHEVNSDISVI